MTSCCSSFLFWYSDIFAWSQKGVLQVPWTTMSVWRVKKLVARASGGRHRDPVPAYKWHCPLWQPTTKRFASDQSLKISSVYAWLQHLFFCLSVTSFLVLVLTQMPNLLACLYNDERSQFLPSLTESWEAGGSIECFASNTLMQYIVCKITQIDHIIFWKNLKRVKYSTKVVENQTYNFAHLKLVSTVYFGKGFHMHSSR